jgi:hypothetical protein
MRKSGTLVAAVILLAYLLLLCKFYFTPGPAAENPRAPVVTPDAEHAEPPPAVEPQGGIQWFPTLQSGLREAGRAGRPILLVAAAPHCAGVPGIW